MAYRGRVPGCVDSGEQISDTTAMQCRNEAYFGECREAQASVEFAFYARAFILLQSIPFVDQDRQRASAIEDQAE